MSYKFLGFALVTMLMVQVINISYTANSYNSNLDYQTVFQEQNTDSKKQEVIEIEKQNKAKLEEEEKAIKEIEKLIVEEEKLKENQAKVAEEERIALEQKKLELAKQKKLEEEKLKAEAKKKLEQEQAKKLELAKKTPVTPTAPTTNNTSTPQTVKPIEPVAQAITGGKEDWLTSAGIPQADWTYVDFIVKRESGWNPKALNKSSGACGLAQALPCAKTGCANYADPVCALKWQYAYVKARYGGYAGAYNFWLNRHWY